MTKVIQIREVPDDVHATLRARAAEAGVSLSDYVLAHVERLASRPTMADVLLRAQQRAGAGPSVEAIVAAVRSARDDRDPASGPQESGPDDGPGDETPQE